jgi:hypothetical protein
MFSDFCKIHSYLTVAYRNEREFCGNGVVLKMRNGACAFNDDILKEATTDSFHSQSILGYSWNSVFT